MHHFNYFLIVRTSLCFLAVRGQLKCDGTRAETRFRFSAIRTSPFKLAGGGGKRHNEELKLLLMSFSPLPCYLVLLRPKYSPQYLILKHPQPMFLPQCDQPSFTPVQNNRKNYSSIFTS